MKYLILFTLLFAACTPSRKACEKNYPCAPVTALQDSIYIHDTIVKRDSVSTLIMADCDSLMKLLNNQHEIIKTDSTGQAQLRIWRDKFNRLLIECKSAPKEIIIPKITRQIKTITKTVTVKVPVNKITGWIWIFFAAMVISLTFNYFLLRK